MPSLQNDGIYQDKPSMIDLSGMSCFSNMHEVWNMSVLSLFDIVFYRMRHRIRHRIRQHIRYFGATCGGSGA
jgi:hypothetical protein